MFLSPPLQRVAAIALCRRSVWSCGLPVKESWSTTSVELPFVDNLAKMDSWNFPRRVKPVCMSQLGNDV